MNNNDFDKRIGLPEEFENYNFKENLQMYNSDQLTEIKKQIIDRYRGVDCKYGFDFDKNGIIQGVQYPYGIQVYQLQNVFVPYVNVDTKHIKLQLKHLSSITDSIENKLSEILELIYPDNFINSMVKNSSYGINPLKCIAAIDYLRLLGYATEQTIIIENKPITLSVDEQIKLGIIEIIK